LGPRVYLLDHYDSFTFNVVHGLKEAGAEVEVHRIDDASLRGIETFAPDLMVLSPGPRRPEDAVLALEAVRAFAGRFPILGICLGMQVLALAWGGKVSRSPEPVHGKTSPIHHNGKDLFQGLPDPLRVGRYHSLHVEQVPACMDITARTEEGLVMGLRHRSFAAAGLQFHPDSFLTENGTEILKNALLGRL
jgi:anthranilate synthase/aminodeoxychorismate synthase-like glutamine amidotransferase